MIYKNNEIKQLEKLTGEIDFLFQDGVIFTPEESKLLWECGRDLQLIADTIDLMNQRRKLKRKYMKKIKTIIKKTLIILAIIVPIYLAGTASGMYYVSKKITKEATWALQNPRQAKWAMERQELVKRASDVLYFEDTNEGMTIIKPYTKDIK